MDFDNAFQVFLSWQSAVLLLGIYVITFTIRTIVEYSWPGSKTNRFWNEVALPIGPFVAGIIIALVAKNFPWPMLAEGATSVSRSARLFYCMACALASGWGYNRLRAWMKASESGTPQPLPFNLPTVTAPTVKPPVNGDVAPPDDKEAP